MNFALAQATAFDRAVMPVRQLISARAAAHSGPRRATTRVSRASRDVLDVSLDDDELRAETELTVLLMIAANDSEGVLNQGDIDRVLRSAP